MKHIISINDFSRRDVESLIKTALKFKQNHSINQSNGKKIASLFFENSTRTRVSSETAAANLGFYLNGFAGAEGTSVKKGEPLIDTVRMFEGYGFDAVIIRHGSEGSARLAADHMQIPVINGGDGSANHPTQTLLDLMTIQEAFGKIDKLKIALVGDLKYGRTVHSLLQSFELFDVETWLVSPEILSMPTWRIQNYENRSGRKITVSANLRETVQNVDVLYMTRIQRERFPGGRDGEIEYQKVSGIYNLTADMLKKANKNLIVLHPLPRYKHNLEISMDVDQTPHARYFEQAKNGLYMRESILSAVFGKGFEGKPPTGNIQPDLWQNMEIPHGKKIGKNFLYRIDNGTLIDHIEVGKGSEILKVLEMEKLQNTALIYAKNLRSKRFGKKDVIGVQDRELSEQELSKLALVADTTINIIRNREVYRKGKVILPNKLEGLIQCQNPFCITNPEFDEHAPSIFYVEERVPLNVRCHYCESPMQRKEIRLHC